MVGWLNRITTNRRLAFAVLLISLFSHGLAVLAVVIKWHGMDLLFTVEYVACIGLSILLNIAAFAVPQVLHFRIIHVIRFLVILISILILEGQSIELPILLLLPVLAETVIYDNKYLALTINIGFILIVGIVLVAQLSEKSAASAIVSVLLYGTITGLSFGFAWFAILYRESLVDSNTRIRDLHTTVMNLSDANVAFQVYADSIETESAEKERNRITRELHDTVGYTLTNVIVMMNAAKVLLQTEPDSLSDLFEKVGSQSETALNETRQILYRLRNFKSNRPTGLKGIYQLTESFSGATGIEITLNTGNLPWSLGQRLDTIVMRFVQEGLTNSFRHGKASRVQIHFWRTIDEIILYIHDNGKGLESEDQIQEGIGLAGMRERFIDLGGMIYLSNVVDGCELRATIPYKIGGFLG